MKEYPDVYDKQATGEDEPNPPPGAEESSPVQPYSKPEAHDEIVAKTEDRQEATNEDSESKSATEGDKDTKSEKVQESEKPQAPQP